MSYTKYKKITKYFNHKGKTKNVFQRAESSINQIHLWTILVVETETLMNLIHNYVILSHNEQCK